MKKNGKFYLSSFHTDFDYSAASLIMGTKAKANYRVRNWKKYDAALKQRGSITFWVSEEVVEQWRNNVLHLTA